MILDIYAPWCGYCRKLQREVYPSQQVREITDQFVRVRIDGEKNPRLMKKFSVRGYPTVIVLNPNGAEIDRIGGYMPARAFARKLRDAQRRGTQGKDLLDQLKGDPESVMLNFRVGVYYYEAGDAGKARQYFLRSYNGRSDPDAAKRRDALYNVAVASMDLQDYAGAIKYWDLYLQNYPDQNRDYTYARYYRGQSNYELGNATAAREDLAFASRHLPDDDARASAARYLAALN